MNSFKFDMVPAELNDATLPDRIPFTKMQGLGNDYVYVSELEGEITNPAPLAVRISDRHFGVGGDGLVLIGKSSKADFRMRIFNADGSEAEMCGNAARCVAKYLFDNGLLAGKQEFSLETLAGIRVLQLIIENGKFVAARVNMGKPVLEPAALPMDYPGENFINQEFKVDTKTWKGTAVSIGNPHIVIAVPDLNVLNLPLIGPQFENNELFPRRVNTEFIQVVNSTHIKMRVWERGSGETLACGTGACAVLVAAVLNGWTEREATVELRGGKLFIEWAEDGCVYKTGPAGTAFIGEFFIR